MKIKDIGLAGPGIEMKRRKEVLKIIEELLVLSLTKEDYVVNAHIKKRVMMMTGSPHMI